MISQLQALALAEDLEHLQALRENRMWRNHLVPEIQRMQTEHRSGMRDQTKSPELRCEHVTGHEDATQLLEFLDKTEARIRRELKEFEASQGILTTKQFTKL